MALYRISLKVNFASCFDFLEPIKKSKRLFKRPPKPIKPIAVRI